MFVGTSDFYKPRIFVITFTMTCVTFEGVVRATACTTSAGI
jgi:hypothetical protein